MNYYLCYAFWTKYSNVYSDFSFSVPTFVIFNIGKTENTFSTILSFHETNSESITKNH